MMQKRGQIAIFVIAAIVIIAAVLFFVLFRGKISLNQTKYPEEAYSVREYAQSCIQQALEEANDIVGIQGGYYNLPDKHFVSNLSEMAYWYYEGKKMTPQKTNIESEISSYISESLLFCFAGDYFPGIELSTRNSIVKTNIESDKVASSVEFRVFLTKNDNTVELDKDYQAEVKSQLGSIYIVGSEIVNKEIANKSVIDIGYLLDQKYETTGLTYGDKEIVYILSYQNQTTNESYMLRFANRFK